MFGRTGGRESKSVHSEQKPQAFPFKKPPASYECRRREQRDATAWHKKQTF